MLKSSTFLVFVVKLVAMRAGGGAGHGIDAKKLVGYSITRGEYVSSL